MPHHYSHFFHEPQYHTMHSKKKLVHHDDVNDDDLGLIENYDHYYTANYVVRHYWIDFPFHYLNLSQ